jgi:hypothetical protein
MNKYIKILFTLMVFITSCEKIEFRNDMIGQWKIFGTGGGVYSQGTSYNFKHMILNTKDDYQFIRNDSIVEQGVFKIIKNDDAAFSNCQYAIEFKIRNQIGDGVNWFTEEPKLIQKITNDSIILYEKYIDGFEYYFARQ